MPATPGRISLDEFKARLPLAEIVGRYVRLTRRGREHVGLCPFHQEKTPSFTVVDGKGFYHCFGCGQHGNAIDFVMALEGLDFAQALQRLSDLTGIPAPRASGERQDALDRGLLAANEAAARWFRGRLESAAGEAARTYLARRSVDDATLARFGLGYAPDDRGALKRALMAEGYAEEQLVQAGLLVAPEDGGTTYDRFRHRVMFPIHDARGRVVGFGGRALGEARAKYLNSPETPLFHKGDLLYGLPLARQAARERGTVVVVEGYMDVIALARAGFANAVAPLGTALTESQLQLLWRLADEPIVCLDGDEAGLRAGHRLIERALPLLAPSRSLRFALMPRGVDPDDLVRVKGREALETRLREAHHYLEFLWRRETAERNLSTPESRAALDQRFRELGQRIADRDMSRRFREAMFRRAKAAFGPPRRHKGAPRPAVGRPHEESVGAARLGAALEKRQVERDLLGPVLAHPELLHEVEEELDALMFTDPQLEMLRRCILDWYGEHGHLDPTGLRAHLTSTEFADLVDGLMSNGPSASWYRRADATMDRVREMWRASVAQHRHVAGRRAGREAAATAIAGGPEHEVKAHVLAADRLINRTQHADAHSDPTTTSSPDADS